MRVSDAEAAVFAKYREDDELVWYKADPSLLKLREGDDTQEKQRDEFVWLRELALDLRDCRAALSACEADYAEAVKALENAQGALNSNRKHWQDNYDASERAKDQQDTFACATWLVPLNEACAAVGAVLSSPRARRVLEGK